MGARRHGQGGGRAPPGNVVNCLCAAVGRSYSKTLSRRDIYALFSLPVVGFWGLRSQTPTGALSLDPLRDFRPQAPNLPTPGKNPAGAYDEIRGFLVC